VATAVIDRAIQVHGAMGVGDDVPLARLWGWHRAMRIFDGPDEVHLRSIARYERSRHATSSAGPAAVPGSVEPAAEPTLAEVRS
jgi:acyl-CoA dehydrogenase